MLPYQHADACSKNEAFPSASALMYLRILLYCKCTAPLYCRHSRGHHLHVALRSRHVQGGAALGGAGAHVARGVAQQHLHHLQ